MAKRYVEGESAPYTELQVVEEGAPPMLPKYKIFLLNATQFGLNFMVLLLSVVVVPAQVEKLVGGTHKGRTMGGMVAGGAAVTFLVSPLIGMVSDRITLRLGKRRPVMLVGTALLCGGLLGMAVSAPEINTNGVTPVNTSVPAIGNNSKMDTLPIEYQCVVNLVERRCSPFHEEYKENTASLKGQAAPLRSSDVAAHAHGVVLPRIARYQPQKIKPVGNLGLYIVFFLLVISSQATVAVPFNALVADLSHPSQRGFNSGVMGAMILLGNVTGALAGISFTHIGVMSMFSIIIVMLVVCVLITTFSISEAQAKGDQNAQSLDCKTIFLGFWTPLKEHDFRWVFITRFLMQQGVATITGFLEYWLNDMIPLPYCWTAATSVALLLLPLLFAAAASSLIFGIVSDKTGYRKIIVALASFIMGLGSFVNAFLSGDYAYYIAGIMAFIIGLGFGAYQSVDFALVMDVLAEDADKAKDIAVWHQALVLPQAIATPLGGVVLDVFEKVNCRAGLGYIIIFILSSLYFLLSGIFVFKIRRAR
ncbi:permease transporter [Plakobranchus ocellatus]|uniref:Permease transporter n=1 Tax=Plakobranchus ocellatus TaxID=259542 RepID=A0AAV3YYD3_9GAST|nr:permease transporter [Plakobranchus ocellatus]